MSKFIDLSGQKFNRLFIISREPGERVKWKCICDCGNITIVNSAKIKSGHTRSCGCLHKESTSKINKTHGLSDTPEYRTWARIKTRCYNKKDNRFEHYGGKGVRICDRWFHSFKNFISDMGKKPTPFHSIDRINTKGNYSPDNCRWATDIEQANNKTNNTILTHNGVSLTIAQWEREQGFTMVISQRLRLGWSIEKAINTPVRKHHFHN